MWTMWTNPKIDFQIINNQLLKPVHMPCPQVSTWGVHVDKFYLVGRFDVDKNGHVDTPCGQPKNK